MKSCNRKLSFFLGAKILEDTPLIISDKSGTTSYLRIVNSDNIYVEQQTLPKLDNTIRFAAVPEELPSEEPEPTTEIKKELEEKPDSDRESIRCVQLESRNVECNKDLFLGHSTLCFL